ncbi:RAM signaling network component [Elasticomyces elasticus]|nr:RAM signaling network component [Elasticomyces elasticus]
MTSSNSIESRRPGVAPLVTGSERSRSQSESVMLVSTKTKRQGLLPPKRPDLLTVDQGATLGIRTKGPTMAHNSARHHIGAGSGGESSSSAVSPVDGMDQRSAWTPRRLSSLPEHRRDSRSTNMSVLAAQRILFSMFNLVQPIMQMVRAIKNGQPQKIDLERLLFVAATHIEELDRQISSYHSHVQDEDVDEETTGRVAVAEIIANCDTAMDAFRPVMLDVARNSLKIVQNGDPMYVRNLMLTIYGSHLELRNGCAMLGAVFVTPTETPADQTLTTQRVHSVTPTQTRPLANRRLRSGTVLSNVSSSSKLNQGLSSNPPPVPLLVNSANNSRSNTMTSQSGVIPRSGDTVHPAAIPSSHHFSSNVPISRSNTMQSSLSRSNTMQSTMSSATASSSHPIDYADEERAFERIFLKLQHTAELAAATLSSLRFEFQARKENVERDGQLQVARSWASALERCTSSQAACLALKGKLRTVKFKDPAVRSQRDYWQICDTFVRSWIELASTIASIGTRGISTSEVKAIMKEVHRSVKDVASAINSSPWRELGAKGNLAASAATSQFAGFASAAGYGSGTANPPPTPATPLSAALGPAVLATVPRRMGT